MNVIIKGNQIVGDFRVDIFDENGSYCMEKNINKSLLWIQFHSLIVPTQSFWLKIKRKNLSVYPILVKSFNNDSYNLKTMSQTTDCHFIAASYLMKDLRKDMQPLEDNLFADTVVDVGDIAEYLPISLCDGISGIVSLPGDKYLVRIQSTINGQRDLAHLAQIDKLPVYSVDQIKGYDHFKEVADRLVRRRYKLHRSKRSFRMPVHNIPGPFLVELFLVVDSKMASMYSQDNYRKLLNRITYIMNRINVAFMQFNVYFAIVQLEIWEQDQIKLVDESHIILELQSYKRQFITKKHDCLHAILGENLGSSRRGESVLASMCGFNKCVGYTKDYYGLSELELAHSVMHEIGHNFGLDHDTEKCQCYGCIMATGVEFGSLKFQWSHCSRAQISSLLKSGMGDCLKDRPVINLGDYIPRIINLRKVSDSLPMVTMSECGNGVVDDGEECDCGGRTLCSAAAKRCCNPDTCKLHFMARCASGACCDLSTCSIKVAGTVCRLVRTKDCDLPEYCDGTVEWCPTDVYKIDGVPCTIVGTKDSSHCYQGECRSRQSWCKVLFGDTANEASSVCYNMNSEGTKIKNCGLNIPPKENRNVQPKYWETRSCSNDNIMCGRLWCSHSNERILRSSPQLETDEVVNGHHCSAARFNLDWFLDDAGLVPNGASCGRGKMCWQGVCTQAIINDNGACYCHDHGVCNNRQHCHCHAGFSAPNCTSPGNGGSVDSGPPLQFDNRSRMIVAVVVVTIILLVTAIVIGTLVYHYNTHQWPSWLPQIKWLNYQKSQLIIETKMPNKFDNDHSRRPKSRFDIVYMNVEKEYQTKESHQNVRTYPPPPIPLITDETVYANIHIPLSPAIDKPSPTKTNANKASAVKSKAFMFDKPPEYTLVQSKNPRITASKPLIKKLEIVNESPSKPQIVVAKPKKGSNDLNESDLRSQLKPLTNVTESKPPLLGSKPKKAGVKPDVLCNKPSKTIIDSKPSIIIPAAAMESTNPAVDQSTTPQAHSSVSKPAKMCISQPRLDQTTCTTTTRDLDATDQTLSRIVAPHKILRLDSQKAVKYLY